MIARSPSERAPSPHPTSARPTPSVVPSPRTPSPDAVEFVRFCYRRRRVGWPELYDEMCAVAGRGLFRGWGTDELSAEGIAFTLFEMSTLAALVHRIVAEDHERRSRTATRIEAIAMAAGEDAAHDHVADPDQEAAIATLRLAHAGA
jgi:hypothetical protein